MKGKMKNIYNYRQEKIVENKGLRLSWGHIKVIKNMKNYNVCPNPAQAHASFWQLMTR